MTESPMADLLTDLEFQAFCFIWERDGRCPLPFADFLRERGHDGAADAAEWAAREPDRQGCPTSGEPTGGPMPCRQKDGSGYLWDGFDNSFRCVVPHDVYTEIPLLGIDSHHRGAATFPAAILAFLHAWTRTPEAVT